MLEVIKPFVWVIWDLLAALIFFHCVHKCASRGFVSTVVGMLIYLVAAVAAGMTYAYIADFLYDNVVRDAIQNVLTRNFDQLISGGGAAKDIVHAIPFGLRMLLGFKRGEVNAMQIDNADALAGGVIDFALKNPLMTILHAAGFLLVFTLAAYAMRSLARYLTGINRLPVVGTVNTVLGGIVGVISGLITLFFSGFILRLLVAVSAEAWWWLNTQVMHNTYIWRLFY